MVLACTVWGLSPLFYKLLADVPPLEVLAHRTLWSLLTFAIVCALRGQVRALLSGVGDTRATIRTLAAAATISANWFGFIYAVGAGRAMEASLGYYIFPLVAVLLGRVVLGDRLRPAQWAAVALAGVGVAVLTVGLGVPPVIALTLALSFGIYSVLKRRVASGAIASVGAEMLVLAPLAALWLAGLHAGLHAGLAGIPGGTESGAFGQDPVVSLLLVLSGPLTGVPLILFAYATKRVSLPTIGLVQYLNPSLQFLCAALILGEAVTRWHVIAFPLIWCALALYCWATARNDRVPAPLQPLPKL